MLRFTVPAIALLLLPTVLALNIEPVAPVLNGEFELGAFPLKEAMCLVFGDAVINVFEPGNPAGLPWLAAVKPCEAGAVKALGWTSSELVQFSDREGDGDREAVIANGPPDAALGNHNMWQSYLDPQQVYTGAFDALSFRVESGAIPAGASVIVSFSSVPFSDVAPWVVIYVDCALRFPASQLVPDASGVVRLDPTDGVFTSYWTGCDDELAAWNAATAEEGKRAVLDELRLVQHSYWNFNTGTAPVVLDGVAIEGARTIVEHAAGV
jgi:hypothetical protein